MTLKVDDSSITVVRYHSSSMKDIHTDARFIGREKCSYSGRRGSASLANGERALVAKGRERR
jgi:hypothetical protein